MSEKPNSSFNLTLKGNEENQLLQNGKTHKLLASKQTETLKTCHESFEIISQILTKNRRLNIDQQFQID